MSSDESSESSFPPKKRLLQYTKMKFLLVVALLCGLALAEDDGQWKGEGLAESQDWGQYNGYYPYNYFYNSPYYRSYYGYYGYGAPLAADGRVVDTPEVAVAKAAHFTAYNAAAAKSSGYPYAYGAYPYYHGYYGSPVELTPDGKYLKDTPEVAVAKSAHFAAHAAASTGAVAAPVADTPAVAAAKSAHFAAYNAAAYKSAYPYYNGYYGYW